MLGKGGWGTVYKGLDLTTAQVVAVKQVPLAGIPPDALQAIMVRAARRARARVRSG